jgi:RNA polymerase sigma factor (sigma-70 family)
MRWSTCEDAELLAASRRDGDAFVEFYDRYESVIVGFMLRRADAREVAVDLASEVFAAALRSAHRYRPDRCTAEAWLFTIARNVLIDSARRGRVEARARKRLGIHEAIGYTTDDLDRIDALASQTVSAAQLLGNLPADQREAVQARIIEERPYPEIALQMQTSELVVRQRVSRGLATLRVHLEDPT